MSENTPQPATDLAEKAQTFVRELGLATKGALPHPKSTSEAPQVIVELEMDFPKSFAILEAYTRGAGGAVSQHFWVGAPYNHGEARFSFSGQRSIVLVSAVGRCVCVVRNNDEPF